MARISLCMIAKDEEQFLQSCLDSVHNLVDEIILVDTGSTDGTIEIAESFGAKIFHYKWDDDFSKPRNVSLEKATGDWILVMDPDERLAVRDHVLIRQLLSAENKAFSLPTRNYVFAKKPFMSYSDSNDIYADMNEEMPFYWVSDKVRLFPNNKNIKFKGPVHEMVESSLKQEGIVIDKSPVPIHHYSQLDKRRSRYKRFFYMNITRKKVLNDPKNAKAYLELGKEYFNLRLYHRAIQTFRNGINLTEDKNLLSELYDKKSKAYVKQGNLVEAEKDAKNALNFNNFNIGAADNLLRIYLETRSFEKVKEMHLRIGKILFNLKRYEKAVSHLEPNLGSLSIFNLEGYFTLLDCFKALGEKKKQAVLSEKIIFKGVPILCYHDIGDIKNDWCLDFDDFKKQIEYLEKEKYEFVTLDKINFKKKQVVLTFDDGRASCFEKVFPFLQSKGIKATFFITTDWTDGTNVPVSEEYSSFMSWKNIKQLSDQGHLIGSHAISHKDLNFLSLEEVDAELSLSKKELENHLDKSVVCFAYPYGHLRDSIVDRVANKGYTLAVTAELDFSKEISLKMPRILILRKISFSVFKRLL